MTSRGIDDVGFIGGRLGVRRRSRFIPHSEIPHAMATRFPIAAWTFGGMTLSVSSTKIAERWSTALHLGQPDTNSELPALSVFSKLLAIWPHRRICLR